MAKASLDVTLLKVPPTAAVSHMPVIALLGCLPGLSAVVYEYLDSGGQHRSSSCGVVVTYSLRTAAGASLFVLSLLSVVCCPPAAASRIKAVIQHDRKGVHCSACSRMMSIRSDCKGIAFDP